MVVKLAVLALGGALGTLARVGLSGVVQLRAAEGWPLGTASVNVIGCMLFGFVYALMESRVAIDDALRLMLLSGFMGAFTTFSTYMFETSQLIAVGRFGVALGSVVLQNVLGFTALAAGLGLGRSV